MATVQVVVNVTNTGNVDHNFVVGATICRNISGSACGLYGWGDVTDLPLQTLPVPKGNTDGVIWNITGFNLTGTFYVIAKVYKSKIGTVPQDCLDGKYKQFTVSGQIGATVAVDVYVFY